MKKEPINMNTWASLIKDPTKTLVLPKLPVDNKEINVTSPSTKTFHEAMKDAFEAHEQQYFVGHDPYSINNPGLLNQISNEYKRSYPLNTWGKVSYSWIDAFDLASPKTEAITKPLHILVKDILKDMLPLH